MRQVTQAPFSHNAPTPVAGGSIGLASGLFIACIPLAWLIPSHYLPWLTAQHEFAALALACVAGLLNHGEVHMPRAWAAAIGLALASVAAQAASGRIVFAGDAVMAALYLLALGGAITLGRSLGAVRASRWSALDSLAAGTAVAAIASVAIALMQWTQIQPILLPVAGLAPGGRPYGNLAQANNFCTATFLGVCALGWLRESRRIGNLGWYAGAAYLIVGMVMSGSRTAWIQLGAALVIVLLLRRRVSSQQLGAPQIGAALVLFAALTFAWPSINDAALLSASRAASDQLQAGPRLPLWLAMIDAVGRQPWWGHGWQQVGAAQVAVALDHPPLQRYFEHSHNLLLDVVLWAGVPVGAGIIGLATMALTRQARAVANCSVSWLLIGVTGVLMHSMLEFPIEYAYFLVPVGLALGALHAFAPGQGSLQIPPAAARTFWAGLSILLAAVAVDYLEAEQNYRTLRLQSTFNGGRIESGPPDLRVLTQLEAYLAFTRSEARAGMTPEQLRRFREVAGRFVHPPVLLRLALAEGLNGEPVAASQTLRRLCAMHAPARCEEGRESWLALQQRFPQLAAIPAPVLPTP